jgi:hypothetical protein
MHSLISFTKFSGKSLHERKQLQKLEYSNWEAPRQYDDWKVVDEDVSGSDKKNKILLLKKLLSNFDKYFHYSDDPRAYRKGKNQQDEIELLVKELGKDGKKIYKKFFEQNEPEYKNEKKRSKKEKEEDDDLVDIKPKIKETRDYMNPRNWFGEMSAVRATGSLNSCDTERKERPIGISYFTDGGDLSFNRPKFVPPSEKHIRDLNRKRTI